MRRMRIFRSGRAPVTVLLLGLAIVSFIWYEASGRQDMPGMIGTAAIFVHAGFYTAWRERDLKAEREDKSS